MRKEILDINIGEAIKEGLLKKRMTQTDLAREMDISPSLASAWVKNQRVPTGKDLIRVAVFLDIVDILFPGYGKKDWSDTNSVVPLEYADLMREIGNLQRKDRSLEERLGQLEQFVGARLK